MKTSIRLKGFVHGRAFALSVSGGAFHQVMSAQPGSEALLREHQGDRSGEVEPGAVDTGAVLPDAAYSAASGAPQMNGTAGGGPVVGPDGDVGARESGSLAGAAVAEGVKDDIAGCPAEASEPQRMQTCTDEGPQRTSSGVIPAAGSLGDAAGYSAMDGMGLGQGVFTTPRSTRSANVSNDGFRPAGAWPGWISRLGDMFKAPPAAWLPSPLPSPPRPRRLLEQGRLRGPQESGAGMDGRNVAGIRVEEHRTNGLVPNYNTPSSSSIPAEAIQAEVQRQLGGLLDRLQQAEASNRRLQDELEVLRQRPVRDHVPRHDVVGGTRDGGGDLPSVPGGFGEPRGNPDVVWQGEAVPREDPPGPEARRRSDPWQNPLGALWEEFQHRRIPSPEPREPPIAASTVQREGEGRLAGQEDSATNAILEALTKNLVGLQELQLKSLRRDADPDDAPEQVKSSNISLPMLAGPDEATAGILFQDWVAQISVPMQDLSATSSTWWKDVMEMVQITYSKWLSATPLERLQLEPVGHERLISSKWTRVNSRACTLILQCLVESVKASLREGWFRVCR